MDPYIITVTKPYNHNDFIISKQWNKNVKEH
jgi:hypothetical protein